MSGWNGHWSISLQRNQKLGVCAYTLQDTRPLTSTNLHARDLHQRPLRRSHTPVSSLILGDFNCQHGNWGYNKTSPDCGNLDSWATANNVGLLYDPKEAASFSSHRWDVGTNPDVALVSGDQDNPLQDRRVLGNFPLSQHLPSHITPRRLKVPVHCDPVKSGKTRKANWKHFCLLTGESFDRLPPPDTTHREMWRFDKHCI